LSQFATLRTNNAQRYIIPLIKPPTPPQLEQDKATIDESFEKAFALLDQLNTDTTALKAAEESRTMRLDSALGDLESVLASLKEADRKREDDSRRNADEIRSLRDLIPKAIEAQKEANDTRLRELGTELKSLRTLVGNRMGGSTAPPPTIGLGHRSTGSSGSGLGYTPSSTAQAVQPVQAGASTETPSLASPITSGNGASTTSTEATSGVPATAAASTTAIPTTSGSSRFGSGKAAIPAWQMAAAKKSAEALNGEKKDTSSSGTAVEASST
jgi:peroxin-14